MLSAVDASALQKCSDNPNALRSNCFGEAIYADGTKYVGEWKDNMRDGQGTAIFEKKMQIWGTAFGPYVKYTGSWRNDKIDGYGVLTFASGADFKGHLKIEDYGRIDFFDGYGKMTYANGDIFDGSFINGLANGKGLRVFINGDRYVGEFRGNEISGEGTLYLSNGDRYHGGFRLGKFQGQGTYTYADGTTVEGIWENNEFLYANTADPTVVVEERPQDNEVVEAASGSGFAVSDDGYIITNNHVIEGCQDVAIHYDGKVLPVTVVTYDLQNDLALLKGEFIPKTIFSLSGDQPQLLQDIYVAGYPFGNEVSSSIKVTKGIISSLTGIGNNFSNIQIDAALQVGNSGGPILNEMGNVVGVAVSKLDSKYMYENFGSIPENTNFGIKANVVKSVLDSNGVSSQPPNSSEITKSELGTMITGGTYYVSCLMTLAQIETLRAEKVMFEGLD